MSPFSGSLNFAGKRGYIPVTANFIATWSAATHWGAYCAGAEAGGFTPNPQDWHVARSIYVAETDAEAEAFVQQPGGAYDYYYDYLFQIFDRSDYKAPFVANKGDDPAQLTHQLVRDACVIHGSPKTVAEKILALRETIGDFGTLLYAAHDWQDKAAMQNSMRLMANDVMPRINDKLNAKVASAG